MIRHLAVFMILLATGYLAVRFGGMDKKYMMIIPAAFVIYLGVSILIPRAKARKERKK